MADQRTYHVTYRDDGWVVEAEDAARPSAREDRKADAVQRAREIAENQQPSRLIIHKQDGTVQSESTYGDVTEPAPEEEAAATAEPEAAPPAEEEAAPPAEEEAAPAAEEEAAPPVEEEAVPQPEPETVAAAPPRERAATGDAGYALAALANDALQLATEAVRLARSLPSKAQERAQELRELGRRREDLNERIRELRVAAEHRFDEKAAQGRTVAEDILGDERIKRVLEQARTAQAQVKAAITSIRKTGTETVSGATGAGREQATVARSQVKAAATSVRKTAETAAGTDEDSSA